jgi:hypothetical protein
MVNPPSHRIDIPAGLSLKLARFRRVLLARQVREGVAWCVLLAVGLLAITMLSDRLWDTDGGLRVLFAALIVAGVLWATARVAATAYRCRTELRVAKQIRQRKPDFGDDLVGALELVANEDEWSRSPALCRAALKQIAVRAETEDLSEALPPQRSRPAIVASAALALLVAVAGGVCPPLLSNALERLALPWKDVPRFTFARFAEMPDKWIVPRGETTERSVELAAETRWTPSQATIQWGTRRIVGEPIDRRRYRFQLPPTIEPTDAILTAGDASRPIRLVPKQRPNLTGFVADIQLPDYLRGHPEFRHSRNVVGDELSILTGSNVTLAMTASASLRQVTVNDRDVEPTAARFQYSVPDDSEHVTIAMTDRDGLTSATPVELSIKRIADERPTVIANSESIPPRVLDSQALSFRLTAEDDFAVRRVGMQWSGGETTGERVIGPDGQGRTLSAVFQANALDAPAGELQVRFWVEDDHPEHERVYSDSFSLTVLSPEDHAVWIAGQFAKWRLAAMDVRDRELSLFQQNLDLARTESDQRDRRWRNQVLQQARDEERNARQLRATTEEGKWLMQQAARNDQVDADDVEQLAGTVETLQELAGQKMPRVADLLNQAAEQESKFAAMQDQESSRGVLPDTDSDNDSEDDRADASDQATQERVGLAQTTIVDTSTRRDNQKRTEQDDEDKLSLAIEDQSELVAQFDQVADQLQSLLGNMEGSTLVKRLKAVSRLQDRVATRLAGRVESTFGQRAEENRDEVRSVTIDITETSKRVRTVLDDLEALCERRDIEHFADVLAEMKSARVLDGLKQLETRVAQAPASSIAAAEFWADTLDRWADDLIDPRSGDSKEKSGPKKSLSPEVVLEVLRILESEVQLREQTRVAEQGRAVAPRDEYLAEAIRLSEQQDLLRDRLDVVVDGLQAAPDGALNFSAEIEVLSAASAAMVDATKTLVQPETGSPAIAAQTEAIELLLQSNKVSPEDSAGGGGGAGAGAGGEADQAAVAMLGDSLNRLAKTRRTDGGVATSGAGDRVPERFREGVAEYFERLERRLSAGEESGR